jgi:hypothetical protein
MVVLVGLGLNRLGRRWVLCCAWQIGCVIYFMRSDNVALAGTSSAGAGKILTAHARPKRNYMCCVLRNWKFVLEIAKLALDQRAGEVEKFSLAKTCTVVAYRFHTVALALIKHVEAPASVQPVVQPVPVKQATSIET